MAIFNSYVSLPEGNQWEIMFVSLLYKAKNQPNGLMVVKSHPIS